MFTGIVEERGTVRSAGSRLEVESITVASDAAVGDSIAVNGVCLTVVGRAAVNGGAAVLSFDLSPETLDRSTLGDLSPGDPVNLERPLTLLTRLGGHMVQGHVDGVSTVEEVREVADGVEMRFALPAGLGRYLVEKGSITVDGVSLTVTDADENGFGVALIPHTLTATTLGSRKKGDRVNLEVDVIAKYVEGFVRRSE